MTSLANLNARYVRRPLLLEPNAARVLLDRLAQADPRGMRSEGRLLASLRKIGLGAFVPRPSEMEDAEMGGGNSGSGEPPKPVAYAPYWAQQAYGEPEDEGFCWSLFQGVALMEIDGAINDRGEWYCGTFYHGYDTILAAMREAYADARVKALFVRVCTPGGVVAGGLKTLSDWVRENRASTGGKPIHFYADMSCSAGFRITSQGDRTSAPAEGLIGSIGATIILENHAGWLKNNGIVVESIDFGESKTDGAWWKPLSEQARADLRAEIDQIGQNFVADVVAGRGQLTPEAVLGTQARVFLAQHDDPSRSALALGLIDAIESEEAAFQVLLDTIAAPQVMSIIVPAGSPGGSPQATTETPMKSAIKTTPKAAAAAVATPKAQASAGDDTASGDDNEDDDEAADRGEGDAPPSAPAEPFSAEGDAPAESSASAIAASPEAQSHPKLALAAISSGQTLAQFRASAAVAPPEASVGGRKVSTLAAEMAGFRRVNADVADGGQKTAGAGLVAAARALGQKKS